MAKRYRWSDGKLHTRPQRSRSQLRSAVAEKRQNADPLYNPSQQLSGSRLAKAADSLVGLEFGPQRKALANEATQTATQSNALTGKASDYFLQLAQQEQGSVDRVKAIGGMLSKDVATSGEQTQGVLRDVGTEADQRLAADTALRGEGLQGGSTALTENLAAARARAASQTQTAGEGAAAQSAGYEGLADLSRQARELRGGEIVGQLANRAATKQQDVRSRQAALEAMVGPARTKNILDLRQQGFENLATAEGLGIDQAKLQAQVQQNQSDAALARQKQRSVDRQNRARNQLTRSQIRATMRGQDISATTQRRGQDITRETQAANRQSREAVARAKRRGGRLESADAKKIKNGVADAYVALTAPDDPIDGNGKTYTNRIKFLRVQGAPQIVIKAARERQSGGLNFDTAAELRALGIKVPRAWLRGGSNYNKGNRPG